MFNLCASGLGPRNIAKELEKRKIVRPSVYRFESTGIKIQDTNLAERYSWSTKTVVGILENEVYLGHTVNCKSTTISYKDKTKVKIPKEEQIRFENTHEAIIDKETWDIVQNVRAGRRRITKTGIISKFSGLLFCGDCGARMTFNSARKLKPENYYFMCASYRRHKAGDCTTAHRIRESVLEEIVREEINEAIFRARENKEEFIKCITSRTQADNDRRLFEKQSTLTRLQIRSEEINKIFRKLYEDNALGRIPQEQYDILSESYTKELSEIKEKIPYLEQEIQSIKDETVGVSKFLYLADKYVYIEELTPEIIRTFISKILIYDKGKDEPKEIEIYFTNIGKI
ncbi:recombinase family protein [Ruminococcus sp.]|uniref:recombinase family protein n=1 Tax=Ruminococcus sp. TaxID=41978 RepID=UPI002E780D49|nr:recombinase family protein [Ruminococcus sp.]MEE1264518.1 recombinase family protein [Ruminococcus sp.]